MKKITLTPLLHRNEQHIAIGFTYDADVKEHLKKLQGVTWSKMYHTYYLPFTAENKNKIYRHFISKKWFVDYSALKEASPLPAAIEKEHVQQYQYTRAQKKMLHEYVAYLRGHRYSESSVRTYYNFILKFVEHIGEKPLEHLTNRDVELFAEEKIAPRNYSLSTHRQCISAIKHFADLYPVTGIKSPELKRPPKSKYLPSVLAKEEVIALLGATRNLKHRAILALIYSSGLRIGELLSLKLKEIDLPRRQVIIRNGKGRKDRVVVLAESILPLLHNYITTYNPKVSFVEGVGGKKYSAESIRAFLRTSCRLAGITKPVIPHTLRHSYATHMLENGIDIRYIQELLGHSKPETTMIYTHVSRKDMLRIESPLDVTVKEMMEKDKNKENILLSRKFNR